jgi:ubiquinone/menaquinone biosynthesis C-methylase UbiE
MRNSLCLFVLIALAARAGQAAPTPSSIPFQSRHSLVHVGGNDTGDNEKGEQAARLLLQALNDRSSTATRKALALFDEIAPDGSFGGECTALKWFCRALLDPEAARKAIQGDALAEYYFAFFTDNDYANLKEYLGRQFRLTRFQDDDPELARHHQVFLDDLMIFASPTRQGWEKTSDVLKLIPLKRGARVADIGCGEGYYACRLSNLVGADGRVYAIDESQEAIDFLYDFAAKRNLDNIITIKSRRDDITLREKVDIVFMASVYHLIYGVLPEQTRLSFIASIRKVLADDGRIVIVDNGPVVKPGQPYPGCYVAKELIITQLAGLGFELESQHQILPQKYVLVFKRGRFVNPRDPGAGSIKPESGISLVHIGSLDSFDITPKGVEAAKSMLTAIEQNATSYAAKARNLYTELIPNENFGGEYSALQWFCEYLLGSPEQKKAMLADPLTAAYFHFLADDNYKVLQEYIVTKYKIKKLQVEDPEIGFIRRSFLEDFILFNNPTREQWEKTSAIMDLLKIRPGEKILDIGCGPGYYSYKFSKGVGDAGRVYAIDIKQEHLDFLNDFIKKAGIRNIAPVLSKVDDVVVRDKVDLAFMCSLYHIIYAVSSEEEREPFVASIRNVLKKDGRLIIVDNGPVPLDVIPYHGPYIAKELIIGQLEQMGFQCVEQHQPVPQRYLLVFKLKS